MRPENVKAWAEGVEFGHPPPSQPPFDQYGTPLPNTSKTEPSNQVAAKAYLDHIGKRWAELEALERVSRQQKVLVQNTGAKDLKLPNTSKTEPYNQDREAYLNHIRRQQAEKQALEILTRQRKILFPNSVPKDIKPEPRPYRIPRKPVSKSNDTTPPPPQAVLLRNGETKRLEKKISTYVERVRDLGYPEALCPLPMREIAAKNSLGTDCTGAKVVKQKDDRQICQQNQKLNPPAYSDGSDTPQTPFLAPEPSPSSTEALALRSAQAVEPDSVSKSTPRVQHIGQPPTAHNSPTDHHLIENGKRRSSVGSNLSRSDVVRRPSNPVVERMAISTGNVNIGDSRKD